MPWKKTIAWYLDVMKKDGPPGAAANGYNENRALFSTGKCGMWIDATVTAGYLYNPKESQVADKVAFAPAPITDANTKASGWFWSWALGIPASTKQADAAKKFVKWATSKDYIKMVGGRPRAGSRLLPAPACPPTATRTTRRRRPSPTSC